MMGQPGEDSYLSTLVGNFSYQQLLDISVFYWLCFYKKCKQLFCFELSLLVFNEMEFSDELSQQAFALE